jgi:hypothetical protein
MTEDIKKWENNVYEWDVSKASLEMNPWLENFGYDRFSRQAEDNSYNAHRDFYSEARNAHGYPATTYLQLALIYAAGYYTA